MPHPGTLFILLFFGLAPGVAVLLVGRSVRRGLHEIQSRGRIIVAAGTALFVWTAATYYMFAVTFATAWGVAHMRPQREGLFPEGWFIYAFLAAYAALGVALVMVVGSIPLTQRSQRSRVSLFAPRRSLREICYRFLS
jgi:hypothetical protein